MMNIANEDLTLITYLNRSQMKNTSKIMSMYNQISQLFLLLRTKTKKILIQKISNKTHSFWMPRNTMRIHENYCRISKRKNSKMLKSKTVLVDNMSDIIKENCKTFDKFCDIYVNKYRYRFNLYLSICFSQSNLSTGK